jgi:glycine/D-amino acid oxidase-like deaminating enzyme
VPFVRNYGHGGCGVTLSGGTAARAADLACESAPRRAAVLGAGAVGLATARTLQERGVQVTIYAQEVPPHTTSDVAGALWSPVTLVDEPCDTAFGQVLAEAARARIDGSSSWSRRYGVRWLPSTSSETRQNRGPGVVGHARLFSPTTLSAGSIRSRPPLRTPIA